MIQYLVLFFVTEAQFLGAHGASVNHSYPSWAQGAETHVTSKDYPCPPADQIYPCICTDVNDIMEMDCSNVSGEKELGAIFHSNPPFPYTHFTKLTIDSNERLYTLPYGIFNNIMFDEIWITNCALKEVQEGSIIESASTLKKLYLYGNLIEMPFLTDEPDMTLFTQLWKLHLGVNSIGVLPDIKSTTITDLLINDNPIHDIHNKNLQGVPNLEIIDLSEISMETIETGLFTNHRYLKEVKLYYNKLEKIEASSLKIQSGGMERIYLGQNRIKDVEPDSFDLAYISGVTISFEGNQLETLDEATWKPLIQNGAILDLADNPLVCGCDIKWAMVPDEFDDTDYIRAMNGATCPNDGNKPIADLDPDWFEAFC